MASRRAAIYTRTSSGTSTDFQEASCEQYAASNGYKVVETIRDLTAGATMARPGLDALRSLAAQRQIRAVIVTGRERLSRSAVDLETLVDEFSRAGVVLLEVRP
jgi:DNA invertase Pin-like site-specific DNA recombinase